ncbi:ATP-binding protein, partial [Roseisolibacter sp. H3M3-2]|uniref:sensor histidine kinase n=1 Tax=Roseisolibacter sp. H3M3-2 TaxID=3031323 RepID=UPI0023DB7179
PEAVRAAAGATRCEIHRVDASGALVGVARAEVEAPRDAPSTAPPDARAPFHPDPERLLAWAAETGRSVVELDGGSARYAPADDPARASTAVRWAMEADGPPPRALPRPLPVRDRVAGVLHRVGAPAPLLQEIARVLAALLQYAALGVERLRLVEEAERAEGERRVEALRGALLTAVSHDLRTPLTTIKGIAHEIARGGDPSRAAVVEAEADRMDALVGDLLDLSRLQAGALPLDVRIDTADELVGAALQRAAGPLAGREVRIDLPDELLAARFDLAHTVRALVNLLENAAKYAPPASPVTVRAARAGGVVRVAVIDAGPGVPAAERARIFEAFYRPPGTPPDVRGTGLGLSIARGIAEAQGGALRYEASAEGGAAFVLELPAAEWRDPPAPDTMPLADAPGAAAPAPPTD